MLKRRSIQIAAVVVVLLFGTLGTAGARQLWNESQAHSAWQSARAAAGAELARARALGLTEADLALLLSTQHRLASATVPTASVLLSSAQADFYSRQSRSYRSLDSAIRREIASVTAATHSAGQQALARLQADVGRARSLAVDTTDAGRVLAAESSALRTAHTPRLNRSITARTQAAAATLEGQIGQKQQQVDAIVRAGGGSAAGIGQRADAAVQSVQGQLNLLALFTKQAATEGAALNRLDASVHAQRTAQAAAVADASLDDEVAVVSHLAGKTLPQKLIVVSTEDQMATMYQSGVQVYSTPVTTGGPELPTDPGIFHIYLKASPFVFHSPWPPGSPYYYPPTPITFWMPFDGAEGLHDASWRSNFGPGSNLEPTNLGTGNYILGTHGCVNLPYAAAQWVWDWAPVGTTVVVT